MTRRFAAGIATGILISIMAGVGVAAYTDSSVAAGPSGTASAHGISAVATPVKQAGGIAGPSAGFTVLSLDFAP
jgi:hypothetical protein